MNQEVQAILNVKNVASDNALFCVKAQQLGLCKGNQGQALVLVHNIVIPPKDYLDWLQKSIFFRYIDRLYWLDPSEGAVLSPDDVVNAVVPNISASDTVRVLCAPRSMEKMIAVCRLSMDYA